MHATAMARNSKAEILLASFIKSLALIPKLCKSMGHLCIPRTMFHLHRYTRATIYFSNHGSQGTKSFRSRGSGRSISAIMNAMMGASVASFMACTLNGAPTPLEPSPELEQHLRTSCEETYSVHAYYNVGAVWLASTPMQGHSASAHVCKVFFSSIHDLDPQATHVSRAVKT